jgi:cell division septum initiation protein DivIVA
MLTRVWTKDYENFLKEKNDLENQKREIDKKIRELE